MDIRTFFNAEFSRLQTANKQVFTELEKTNKIVDSQIDEFEKLNLILRGVLGRKKETSKKETSKKESTKLKSIQTKLVKSITNLVHSSKPKKEIVTEDKKTSSIKIASTKLLFPHLTIQNASFKNINLPENVKKQTSHQSSQDFYRTDDVSNMFEEKIAILKRIDRNLSNSPNFETKDVKEDKSGGGFFGNIKGIIGSFLGGGAIASLLKKLKLPGIGKLGGIAKIVKGVGKVGTKALPIVGAVYSIYDMVKSIKTGISHYKKFNDAGDKLGAQSAISSTLMNVFGNTINVVGSFLPGPLGIALFALGTSMTMVSDSMRETKGRTSGYVGEAREKVAKTEHLIDTEKQKGTLVQLRPNFKDYKNIYWEYNTGNEWKPIVDSSTGKYLSAMGNKNPIIRSTDPKLPGIQTYKLNTKHGIREIVMDNGRLFMVVPNVGKVNISTRRSGGPVVKNKTYVVGEHQAETYVPNSKNNRKKEQKIKDAKAELKKQGRREESLIDNRFKSFLADIKEIRSIFSVSSGVDRRGSNSAPSDNTFNTAGTIAPGKEYKTANILSSIQKTEIGARYSSVKNHLLEASQKTGIPLETLVKFAHVESSFQTGVKAKTSSATGLFQFTGRTWRGQLKKYGEQFGLTDKAERTDPQANAIMGATYIKDNMDTLKRRGLSITEPHIYLLHFLGPGGGPKLIKTALSSPDTIAADILPESAASNPDVFYSNGIAKTVSDIYQWASKKMNVDVSYMNSYSVGAWNVDKDQDAFVHKGEIIMPEYYANKIRAEAKSGNIKTTTPEIIEEYDIYSDSNFWINTFMPALANVVKMEFGGDE